MSSSETHIEIDIPQQPIERVHRDVIFGLIQTTINRTFLDLERKQLLYVEAQEQRVDWTNLRTLYNEINWLYNRDIGHRLEALNLDNIIIELQKRAFVFGACI